MNANELLAYNQGYNAGLKAGIDLNTEPMLRQQQNEIEELKKFNKAILKKGGYPYPLLTDEEIGQFKGEWYRGDYASFYDLVRAILRKTQEK